MLDEAMRARQTMTADGKMVLPDLIDGLRLKETGNILARNGVVTELWRPEWFGEETRPGHVVHATIAANNASNWHCHKEQNDLLFVIRGLFKIAFYDGREDSPTYKKLNVISASHLRPTLVYIPNRVWHCLKNIGHEEGAYITMNDRPFIYEKPDDWKLPPGDPSLPDPF